MPNFAFIAAILFLYVSTVLCKVFTFVYKSFALGVRSAHFVIPNSCNNVFEIHWISVDVAQRCGLKGCLLNGMFVSSNGCCITVVEVDGHVSIKKI